MPIPARQLSAKLVLQEPVGELQQQKGGGVEIDLLTKPSLQQLGSHVHEDIIGHVLAHLPATARRRGHVRAVPVAMFKSCQVSGARFA